MTMNRLEFEEETSPCISPDRQFLLNQIKFNKKIKGSKGAYLYTEKGEPILDFLAQYRAVSFGYNPDDLTQIIKEKLDTCTHGFIQPFIGLIWANINSHVEHHLYPYIPFYRLPVTHKLLSGKNYIIKSFVLQSTIYRLTISRAQFSH